MVDLNTSFLTYNTQVYCILHVIFCFVFARQNYWKFRMVFPILEILLMVSKYWTIKLRPFEHELNLDFGLMRNEWTSLQTKNL